MKQNLITLKIKYDCNESILDVIRQYNSVLHFTYNRLIENPEFKTSELTTLQKSLNNVESIGSHLRNSAIYDARSLVAKSRKPIIFGGKYLFNQRCNLKINKQDFRLKRYRPLSSIGEANQKANRLFTIIDNRTILFKLNKHKHFQLILKDVGCKRSKEIDQLIKLQNERNIAITYKLDLDYIYLIFDYNAIKEFKYSVKKNRVFAIDLNPNSIGWSVVDWRSEQNYHVVQAGTFSLKPLNDYRNSKSVSSDSKFHKYITNKRNFEIIEIAKQLFKLCKHYKSEIFSIEQLKIEAKDNKIGRKFNRLVNNNWNRNLLINQLIKHINSSSTTLVQCLPEYNSYIGNLIFRKECLPDECLASIEIGRRGFEFATQYILNRRPHKKTVIYPELELVKNQLALSLEELSIDIPNLDSWKDILSAVKESKKKYRFSISDAQRMHLESLFSKFHKRKYLIVSEYL